MKVFLLSLTASIAAGYASYYLVRGCFKTLLWLSDYELTTSQRMFVTDNGYLAFVAGMVVGMVVFWRVFRVHKA
jgi:hypothetical protein|tara:strand:+ start:129 stop:350 length:222 start_codon:yes stop_codon:yes gene_type:complete